MLETIENTLVDKKKQVKKGLQMKWTVSKRSRLHNRITAVSSISM